MDSHKMFVFLVIYFIIKSYGQFTSRPGLVDGCLNRNVTLLWNITDYETVQFVTWKKGASPIMSQSGQNAPTSTLSNIKHGGNGAVVILDLQLMDGGEYSCDIFSALNVAYSSTATLSILVPSSYPPHLNSIKEADNMKHACVVDKKGTPKVAVPIKAPDESIGETVLNTGPIIGGVVGSVIVLAIGIVIAVLMFKRRNGKLRSKDRSPNQNNQMSQEGPNTSIQDSAGDGSQYLEMIREQERSTNTNNQTSQEGPYTSMQYSTANKNEYLEINREQGQQQTGDTKMCVNLQLNVQ